MYLPWDIKPDYCSKSLICQIGADTVEVHCEYKATLKQKLYFSLGETISHRKYICYMASFFQIVT